MRTACCDPLAEEQPRHARPCVGAGLSNGLIARINCCHATGYTPLGSRAGLSQIFSDQCASCKAIWPSFSYRLGFQASVSLPTVASIRFGRAQLPYKSCAEKLCDRPGGTATSTDQPRTTEGSGSTMNRAGGDDSDFDWGWLGLLGLIGLAGLMPRDHARDRHGQTGMGAATR
jgi:hypothetical protein